MRDHSFIIFQAQSRERTNHLLLIKVFWLRECHNCTFTENENEDVTIIQVNVAHLYSDPLQITQFTPSFSITFAF